MEYSDERKDNQFLLMLRPAQERLKKYDIEELCKKGDLTFDEITSEFHMRSMDQDIVIHYPDYEICQELEMWHYLTLLQYMDTADGTPLSGKNISLSQMRGGISRGHGYEKHIDTMFLNDFQDVTAERFRKACELSGGEIVPSKADVSAVIFFAPRFPVTVNFWEADDEYPISVKVLLDESAEHYLGIEAAGAACLTVVERIRDHLLDF